MRRAILTLVAAGSHRTLAGAMLWALLLTTGARAQGPLEGTPLAEPVSAMPQSFLGQIDPQMYRSHIEIFRDRLYLLVCADDPEPFVGQQVNLSIYLVNGCSAVMEVPDFLQPVQFNVPARVLHHWRSNRASQSPHSFTPLTMDDYESIPDPKGGAPVYVLPIWRVALWPTAPGPLNLGTLVAGSHYQVQGFNRYPQMVLTTNPLILNVRPLPGGAGPSTQPVGHDFTLDASITPSELAYDEAATLRVEIAGVGLPDWFSIPDIDGGDLFSVEMPPVPPEPSDEVVGDQVVGRRVYNCLVRFNRTGALTIPPIECRVFNTDTGRFETLRSEPLEVTVSAQATENAREITGSALRVGPIPESVGVSDNVLLEIETTGFLTRWRPRPMANQTALGWILITVPGLALLGAAGASVRRARLSGEMGATVRLRRRAARHMRRAERARRQGNAEVFHAELAAAVHGHMSERLGVSTHGLAWPTVEETLTDRGVPQELRRKLANALEQSDFVRFAPGADGSQAMDALHRDTTEALRDLSRCLSARRNRGDRP